MTDLIIGITVVICISAFTVLAVVSILEGHEQGKWLDEVESYTCANLKDVLINQERSQFQEQFLIKKMIEDDCI